MNMKYISGISSILNFTYCLKWFLIRLIKINFIFSFGSRIKIKKNNQWRGRRKIAPPPHTLLSTADIIWPAANQLSVVPERGGCGVRGHFSQTGSGVFDSQ